MTRRYVSGWLTCAVTIFALGQALAMETLPGEPEVEDAVEAARARVAPSDAALAIGRVVAVDDVAGRITLEFRPIPQFFPEGGTRIFRVEDPQSLKGVAPGDKVRFAIARYGRSYTIVHIENSN
jgi:Cu/Ag efflux protein CusF